MFNILLTKAIFLFFILLLASISDIRTHEVSDIFSILIGLIGLIGVSLTQIPGMLLSALVITLPMFIIEMIKPGRIGGADIKITAASAFLLGIQKSLIFILVGLFLAIITNLIFKAIKRTQSKEPFALIPYLSIGCMVAFLV